MNKLGKTLSRVLATPNKGSGRRSRRRPQRQSRRTRGRRPASGRRPRRPRTVNNPAWGRSLPAAYASHVRSRFNVMSRTATSARVAGCDLVYSIPSVIQDLDTTLFTCITANPAYWKGTRIAQFAPAYMNYRPLALSFSYIPQVSVTQAGTVFMGTLWNGAASVEDIQQTLVTSNGGCLTQCYIPCDTRVSLGSNLQQNLFTLSGSLNEATNPFLFLAGVRGTQEIPGYFYVTYMFEFKNPIGQAWTYGRSKILRQPSIPITSAHPNSTLVLLNQSGLFGPGTILDLENDGIFYRGSKVELSEEAAVIEFYNQQGAGSVFSGTIDTIRAINSDTFSSIRLNLFQLAREPVNATGQTVRITPFPNSDDVQIHLATGTVSKGSWYYELGFTATGLVLLSGDDLIVSGGALLTVEKTMLNQFLLPR